MDSTPIHPRDSSTESLAAGSIEPRESSTPGVPEGGNVYCHHGVLRGACGLCRCEAERDRLREALTAIVEAWDRGEGAAAALALLDDPIRDARDLTTASDAGEARP